MKKGIVLALCICLIIGICGCSCSKNTEKNASLTTTGTETGITINNTPICLGHTYSEYVKDYPNSEITIFDKDITTVVKPEDTADTTVFSNACHIKYNDKRQLSVEGTPKENDTYGDIIANKIGVNLSNGEDVTITIGDKKITKDTNINDIKQILKDLGAETIYENSYGESPFTHQSCSYKFNNLYYLIMGVDGTNDANIISISTER
ncbi:MAG: hypothetical protein K5644_06820 [Lachnospiraceae bacterium]|nr:hypothetical protein [Lachnospiraceae bacterium]